MTFPECFTGAYAGWSAAGWAMMMMPAVLFGALVSMPFWIRRDRFWGAMAIFSFASFASVYGFSGCASLLPDWVMVAMWAAASAAVAYAYVLVFRGNARREPPTVGSNTRGTGQ